MKDILSYFNYTKILVFIVFAVVIFFYDKKKDIHKILLAIVSVCFFNEVIALFFIFKNMSIGLLYTLIAVLHNSLWLFLMSKLTKHLNSIKNVIFCYIFFCIFNLFFLEGYKSFNYNIFILGAFIYLIFFIYESFFQLKKENFSFFLSNDYLLLSAPVLFFFGLSFIFGFKSYDLSSTHILGNMRLYDFIGYFVNSVYYGLIAVYIYREKKVKNGT